MSALRQLGALTACRLQRICFIQPLASCRECPQSDGFDAECVANGNRVLFNYYSDVSNLGGELDYRQGFDAVRQEVDRMIARYPDRLYTTHYLNQVITTGRLHDEKWGYEVCTNLSADNDVNTERLKNGKPFNKHFRAINADFKTTRRCCTGIDRNCESCFDTWEHFS